MICPKCDSKTTVLETRVFKTSANANRIRKCLNCEYRFNTHELTTEEFETVLAQKNKYFELRRVFKNILEESE